MIFVDKRRQFLIEHTMNVLGIVDEDDPIYLIVDDAMYHAEEGASEDKWRNAAYNGIWEAIEQLKRAASIIDGVHAKKLEVEDAPL